MTAFVESGLFTGDARPDVFGVLIALMFLASLGLLFTGLDPKNYAKPPNAPRRRVHFSFFSGRSSTPPPPRPRHERALDELTRRI
jgi:hypothetical protein